MQASHRIADAATAFIAATPKRQHAPEVLDAAKMCLVDWFGVALGASREPAAQAVRRAAARWNSGGRAHILLGPAGAPLAAVLVNGTMAPCMGYDDTPLHGAGPLSPPTWATALAAPRLIIATHQRRTLANSSGMVNFAMREKSMPLVARISAMVTRSAPMNGLSARRRS